GRRGCGGGGVVGEEGGRRSTATHRAGRQGCHGGVLPNHSDDAQQPASPANAGGGKPGVPESTPRRNGVPATLGTGPCASGALADSGPDPPPAASAGRPPPPPPFGMGRPPAAPPPSP